MPLSQVQSSSDDCLQKYVSYVEDHPASELAGYPFIANLRAFPYDKLSVVITMMRMRKKFLIRPPAQSMPRVHTLSICIGSKQRQTLLTGSYLCATLLERLMRVQGTHDGKSSLNHISRIKSRLGFLVSQNNAEILFQKGCHFKDKQLYSDAAKSWAQAIMLGHHDSHAFLSTMLLEGRKDVPKNENLAFVLASIGTDFGCAHSEGVLGRCLVSGVGVPQNKTKGFLLGMKSMEKGSFFGQHLVGMCYNLGFGVSSNYEKAIEFYGLAALQGHADAQYRLAIIIYYGQYVGQGIVESMRFYHLAAYQGHALAQYNLANMFHFGYGCVQSCSEAMRFYKLAAEQGHLDALYHLGNMFATGQGVERDNAEAARFYMLASEKGHAYSKLILGDMFAAGQGVPQDYAKAVQLYRLASAHELPEAEFNLAIMLANGKGVKLDEVEAMQLYGSVTNRSYTRKCDDPVNIQLYRHANLTSYTSVHSDTDVVKLYHLAAKQGHASAQYNLAVMTANGRGVTQDGVEAMNFYKQAIEQGYKSKKFFAEDVTLLHIAAETYVCAQYCLGEHYRLGSYGIVKNPVESVKFYRLAAEQGCVEAQYWLGWMYHNTKCGEVCRNKAIKEAIKWYKLAAARGYKQALGALKQLSRCKKVLFTFTIGMLD
jgi:TPR repeat protein